MRSFAHPWAPHCVARALNGQGQALADGEALSLVGKRPVPTAQKGKPRHGCSGSAASGGTSNL